MGTNGAVRYLKVWIQLLPYDEGGRRTPLDLSSEWPVAYKPQLRVRGDARLLDVEFVAGPSEPVFPGGDGAHATIRLPSANGAAHPAFPVGTEFDVLEGPRLIGHGRVTSGR
jgi:hypothetical protein